MWGTTDSDLQKQEPESPHGRVGIKSKESVNYNNNNNNNNDKTIYISGGHYKWQKKKSIINGLTFIDWYVP